MPVPPHPPWQTVLAGMLALQTVNALLLRAAPTIAPFLTANAGLSPAAIGYLNAAGTVGAIGFLLIGAPLIRRHGSLRTLQFGCLLATAGAALYAIPSPVAVLAATLLIGIGYGPSPAAGSDVLQRFAPPGRRNLIFSIKQAGVPLGGALAGLILPQLMIRFGIEGVVLFALLIGVCATLAVQPLQPAIDATRDPDAGRHLSLLSRANLSAPFQAVAATPSLLRLALCGMCLSACQGTWFTFLVTLLVVEQGYSLTLAGLVFAATQISGIFGRIALGWAADRLGSGRQVLAATGVGSALCSLALAASSAAWPVWALLTLGAIAGIAVSSWNGVHVAEVVKVASGDVATAAAGATAITFCGYLGAPLLLALLLAAGASYAQGFVVVAVIGLTGAVLALPRSVADRGGL